MNTDNKMTLEQIRDEILRFQSAHPDARGSQSLDDCAASIDAHLSSSAEPVAWRYRIIGCEWELFDKPPCLGTWGPNEDMEPLFTRS